MVEYALEEPTHGQTCTSDELCKRGTFKGIRRADQQIFVDTYSRIAHAKLYTTKTPITAADMLNDQVLPFYEEHRLPMLRIPLNGRLIIVAEPINMTTNCISW